MMSALYLVRMTFSHRPHGDRSQCVEVDRKKVKMMVDVLNVHTVVCPVYIVNKIN